jgi:hypothetical protein
VFVLLFLHLPSLAPLPSVLSSFLLLTSFTFLCPPSFIHLLLPCFTFLYLPSFTLLSSLSSSSTVLPSLGSSRVESIRPLKKMKNLTNRAIDVGVRGCFF